MTSHPSREDPDRNGARSARPSDVLSFGLNFLKHPAMLGSIFPSSRYLVRRTLRWVDWSRADLFVEFGPGVGTFTGEILSRMKPDARLVVFETNPDFVRHLESSLPDRRLEVVPDSAETLEDLVDGQPVDYVLSGIPFSLMPPETRDRILAGTCSALAPDGAMLVYQFSPRIRRHLERTFSEVRAEFEPRNFLPAMVFHCNCGSA